MLAKRVPIFGYKTLKMAFLGFIKEAKLISKRLKLISQNAKTHFFLNLRKWPRPDFAQNQWTAGFFFVRNPVTPTHPNSRKMSFSIL